MEPMSTPASSLEHPEGTKALIISILSIACCGPLAIWSFIISKKAKDEGSVDTKIQVSYIISIVALVLTVISVIGGFLVGIMGVLGGS